jgi:hypothetical protein
MVDGTLDVVDGTLDVVDGTLDMKEVDPRCEGAAFKNRGLPGAQV